VPAAVALISTEIELPVVTIGSGEAPLPGVFDALWGDLSQRGWIRGEFGVSRDHPSAGLVISSSQGMSTDTGPVIELITSPASSVAAIAAQLSALQAEARSSLERRGGAMLAIGVHPSVRPTRANYYRYRTPRPAYDYAVDTRGWRHWSILDKAAVQELVDVDFAHAPRAIRMLHRLAGLMNFLLRNDPGLHARQPLLSVRPRAWQMHVPERGPFAADARRVLVPRQEIERWQDYLSLLWTSGPMFLAGTKNDGQAWIAEHPTFHEFLSRPPRGGWPATLLDGRSTRVVPEHAHVIASDWTYMGFARIRWKWRPDPPPVEEIAHAFARGTIEELLAACLEKVVIENRSTSTQPPGDELVSLALVSGLVANLDESEALSMTAPYSYWRQMLHESTHLPLQSMVEGRSVPQMLRELLSVARRGLLRRGEPAPDRWLAPLMQRLDDRSSASERRLEERRRGGLAEVILRSRL
jgi:hypothetical protein